ncbi:family 43 glycosylhydrolase [uncultured Friedmanniella sp.]|uniref:family 43 glycosylhydrolase n=1 Tax=uncultured Friedmanniella sp. TaxID=335381 RepID=UPI0035CC0CF2
MRTPPALLVAAAATTALALVSPALTPTASAGPVTRTGSAAVTRAAFTNPVSSPIADTFADPSLLRGLDGAWYAYGTSDPLREGEETPHRIPVARSADLVHWASVADAFSDATLPSWADTSHGAALWAPDIRYVDGQYRMYYVVTETTVTDEPNDNAVGLATAPSPTGPWTDSGAPVLGPRRGPSGNPGDFLWSFDPSAVTDTDGSQWLFYGSYNGGISTVRLSADGTRTVGTPTRVAIDNKFEGAYPVHRGDWWYLFASTANCCAGPTTGYSVQVGRSRRVDGPYVDAQGVSLTASRAGGTPTLVQNGNRWVGAGHNAVLTDLAGQDWFVYHAIDRADPYLDGTDGINRRPMLMDRLDWVHGWPAVRAGRGPSAGVRTGPATGGRSVTTFAAGLPGSYARTGSWTTATDAQSGSLARSSAAGALRSTTPAGAGVRVEADLRSTGARFGLQADAGATRVRAVLDPVRRRLTLTQTLGGQVLASVSRRLPAGTTASWHVVSLTVRAGHAVADVSSARLGDPVAVATLSLRGSVGRTRSGGAYAGGAGVDVDNLSALPAARPVRQLVADRVANRLDRTAGDEFSGDTLAPGWSWVRPDAAATVTGGRLRWPTEAADLGGTANNAGVLLRSSPGEGRWTVQTKVSVDLGVDTVRNFSQAGLVAYVDDDEFARLSAVAIWDTRQTEFGHETSYAGRLSYGGTIVGPPAATTWLRLTHRLDPRNGEHELRAWTSRDGRSWVKGGVWTLPAGSDVRVGLVSQGGAGATARFDYLRVYR